MSDHNAEAQARIVELRAQLDELDCRLVKMLNQRTEIALEIRGLKPEANWGLYDPKREEEIFANLAKCNEGPLYGENLKEIYEAILHVMKEMRG